MNHIEYYISLAKPTQLKKFLSLKNPNTAGDYIGIVLFSNVNKSAIAETFP